MVLLHDVVKVLETLYPLRYAEQWDEPGLIVGMPNDRVSHIAIAVDPTTAVIDEAISRHADLIICHHPLFFRAVHEVAGAGFRGAIVGSLYRHHCALWVGHTNVDAARRGVAQAAADEFGLTDQRPLVPIEGRDAGGQASAGSHPAGDDAVHDDAGVGIGRVGVLPKPVELQVFARYIAKHLPHTELGVQVGGDLKMPVRRVAVLPGSGDSLFDEVRRADVDVYVTSDLRHHPATDALQQAAYEAHLPGSASPCPRPALINTPHSAIESLWTSTYALKDIPHAIQAATSQRISIERIELSTDPWTMAIR